MKALIKFSIVAVIAVVVTSCAKTVVVSDGVSTKKVKIHGKVEVLTDTENNTYTRFESVKGTKYTLNDKKYTVSTK
ncbi:MAG: hypothetical protein U0V72_13850 [Cytophagales bacterium]